MKFGLENIATLCAALGHPERAFPRCIVAGTNGKGRSPRWSTRRFTPPVIAPPATRRRISIGSKSGSSSTDARLNARRSARRRRRRPERGRVARRARRRSTAPPTFFECATATAFELFRRARRRRWRCSRSASAAGWTPPTSSRRCRGHHVDRLRSSGAARRHARGDRSREGRHHQAGCTVVCGPLPPDAAVVIRDIAEQRVRQ